MSRELKIAILIFAAVGMAIWGVNFLLGKNLFSSSQTFYVEYEDIQGLSISTPVEIQGYQVGTVQDIYFNDERTKLIVVLDIVGDLKVPKDAIVQIWTASFTDGLGIRLDFRGKNCFDGTCAQSGDYLKGRVKNFAESMLTPEDAGGYITKGLSDIAPSIRKPNPDTKMGQFFNKMYLTIDTLSMSMQSVDDKLAKNSGAIQQKIKDTRLMTDTLNASAPDMKKSVENVDKSIGEVAQTNWTAKVNDTKNATDSLKLTLHSTNQSIASADAKMKAIANGEGMLGRIIAKAGMHDSLNTTINTYKIKADSIRNFPENYTGRGEQ